MRKTIYLLLIMACMVLFLQGCITSRHTERDIKGLDRTLDMFTYIEEGNLIALVASTYATRLREAEAYIPLEVSIANKGLANLTITRESFMLVDEEGNNYPLVPTKELLDNYEKQDFDRSFAHIHKVVYSIFDAYTQVESNFEPDRFGRRRIVIDKVELPKFSYLIDMLYFRKPKAGLKGKKFELFLTAQELEEPVFVKFMVE
ncbi:MAG: hypothetical protein AB1756_06840 [Acidobacteriota bacterium]